MKKICLLLLSLLLLTCTKEKKPLSNSQPFSESISEIDSAYIAKRVINFTLENNKISPKGIATFVNMFQNSQFVVFGEKHNSKQTALLTNALIPIMHKLGYNNICFEVGPYSAKKLTELSTPHNNTVKNLYDFNNEFGYPEFNRRPIPFFSGIEDAEFLKTASEYNMNIIGLDQEHIYSAKFLFNELLKLANNNPKIHEITASKIKADSIVNYWLAIDKQTNGKQDVFTTLLNDDDINKFFDSFSSKDTVAFKIIEDLKISWDIYSHWQTSHLDRVSYMRNNFLKHYQQITKNKNESKFFLKFGQAHASQQLSNGAYDLGYFVNEIAKSNNTKSVNINSWIRFQKRGDSIVDNSIRRTYSRLGMFIGFGKIDEYTMIDLKSIRNDVQNGIISLPNNGDYTTLEPNGSLFLKYSLDLRSLTDSYSSIGKKKNNDFGIYSIQVRYTDDFLLKKNAITKLESNTVKVTY